MKLAELRARKQRVEQLVGLLSAMRMEDSLEGALAATDDTLPTSERSAKTLEAPAAVSSHSDPPQVMAGDQAEASGTIGLSAEAIGGSGGPSEMVRDDEARGMAELQERIK